MIIDTTVSFQEKRVCMAQQLYAAVQRKQAKKSRAGSFDMKSEWEGIEAQSFARLMDCMERYSIYLSKARSSCHNQTVVEL